MFVVGGVQKEDPNAEGKIGREQQRSLSSLQKRETRDPGEGAILLS